MYYRHVTSQSTNMLVNTHQVLVINTFLQNETMTHVLLLIKTEIYLENSVYTTIMLHVYFITMIKENILILFR